ncbi:MAG: family 10 glycosylhydrolase [Prevotella sp.]|nr:family 10 glycosylhydrolase [Prevotella sp.]
MQYQRPLFIQGLKTFALLLATLFLAAGNANGQTFNNVSGQEASNTDCWAETPFTLSPKYEVRAVWLTTIGGLDWPHSYANGSYASVEKQKNELTRILDQLKADGVNVVLLQTRVRATTIYPSALEPWDGCLSGKPGVSPGYDALQFAIDECHKRGMQLHAWVVTIPIGKWNSAGCVQLRKRYPKLVKKIGQEGYMNPEMSQTGTYIADICEEIVKNYDVDGIHLDYIRYPETWKIRVSRTQGRRYITNIAETISQRVKNLKPWVMMSCSPIGKADDLRRYSSRGWNAYSAVCQDAQGWLRTGVMDALFPMMYFRDNHFYPFAIDWKEQSHGKIVAPGVATYMLHRHEGNWPLVTITQELNVLRQLGLGQTHFRSKFLTDNTKGIETFWRRFNQTPALIPPMTWKKSTPPVAPTDFQMNEETGKKMVLSWRKGADNNTEDKAGMLYNIYVSRTWPVDIKDAKNLLKTRLQTNSVSIDTDFPKAERMYYAVTAVDRYGNESEPLQSYQPQEGGFNVNAVLNHPGMLRCNGTKLQLPTKSETLDADMLTIETMQGRVVKTILYRGTSVDVSKLPEGMYQLRSLNRRGVTHRLGFFAVKH